jgi:hypothetical protein
VGCGAGAASLPLVPPATALTGLDSSAEMLRSFAAEATVRSVPYGVVEGRWPDVAGLVPPAYLVVCHHVDALGPPGLRQVRTLWWAGEGSA